MKPTSKNISPCQCVKMGFMMRFLFLTFIGRAVAFAASIDSPVTSNATADLKNSSNEAQSMNTNNRPTRAVFSESNDSSQISEDTSLEESNADGEILYENSDKRSIPNIRFGRSDSAIPVIRFGRSQSSAIPSMRFGRSQSSAIPSMRFGRSQSSAIPSMRFGRSQSSAIPSMRFGRSQSSAIPSMRFGRSDASMIPTVRFGRSDSSMIPTIRFGRSVSTGIPSMRFGRSGSSVIPGMRYGRSESSAIPTIRFGRSDSSMIPSIRFGRSSDSMIPSVRFGRTDNSILPNPRFGRTYENVDDSVEGSKDEELDSILEQNQNSGEDETISDDSNSNFKRESNDTLIPQIRYGRSSSDTKNSKVNKPQYFGLPNIRPGRTLTHFLNSPEETNEPYISDAQGFLGLFGAFRHYNEDASNESQDLEDVQLGNEVQDFLIDTNTENLYKDLDKQSQISNQDTPYVIPYPRPGKRQLKTNPSIQKSAENYNRISSPNFSKINKVSDFLVPYPRPGKKLQGPGPQNYAKLQKSALALPYPRPGRSNIMLPFPRPGRSSNDGDTMLPYPRYGKSKSDTETDYKMRDQDSERTLLFNSLGAGKVGNFKNHNSHEYNSNPIFMLPYPRPGRNM